MMNRIGRQPEVPCVEALEPRLMMSGNIVAESIHGMLHITGDAGGNGVRISRNMAGNYVVNGVDHGGATTVNGAASAVVSGVTRGVQIRTGAGNDMVLFGNSSPFVSTDIDGNIVADMGSGTNVLGFSLNGGDYLGGINLERNLTVRNRDGGNAYVVLAGTQIGGSVNANFGRNTSSGVVFMDWEGVPFWHVRRGYVAGNIRMAGCTTAALGGVDVNGNVSIRGGSDNDRIIITDAVIEGRARIVAGSGADRIIINNETEIVGALNINTGWQTDTVDIADAHFSHVRLNLGPNRRPGPGLAFAESADIESITTTGNLNIATGGAASVRLGPAGGARAEINGNLSVRGSRRNPAHVTLRNLVVVGNTRIKRFATLGVEFTICTGNTAFVSSGGFSDVSVEFFVCAGMFRYRGTRGRDFFDLTNSALTGPRVSINSNNASDRIFFNTVTLDGSLAFNTGGGANTVEFTGVDFGDRTVVRSGRDVDEILFIDCDIFDPLRVLSGGGNDTIEFDTCERLDVNVFVNGGSGDDMLIFDGSVFGFPAMETRNVEITMTL